MLSLEHTPPSQPLRQQQATAITSSQNVISCANHEEKELAIMERTWWTKLLVSDVSQRSATVS
jgi:hypothetical protein